MSGDLSDGIKPPHRQPAYDAVYRIIAACPPVSTKDNGRAYENARVWRAVEAALDAMEAAGLMLPAGTRTVEQFAARVLLDGKPVDSLPEATTRVRAQARVDYHARMRAENPDWRGSADLVHRRQHTTPWEQHPVDRHREDYDAILDALGDVPIRFWVCPIPGHSDRKGPDGRPVLTVEWRGDVAYCTADDCGRNSQQTSTEENP